ncbi:MAG: leucyl aminopeptidase family protein, partial [Terriglobales bacterium]
MKITLSLSPAAQVETECLVAVVLDRAENNEKAKPGRPKNDKAEAFVSVSDKAVQQAAADLISSGDVAGKIFELSWLHKPAAVKAKRLLLVGGGKAKSFSVTELRKLAGAAVRALKPRNLRSLAFVVPEQIDGEQAVKAIVEGALAGNFDPDTYKSDRKDQTVESVTVIATGNQKALQHALDEGRIIGEAQNFTRELVNEPSNRMTPTILAQRAQEMSKEFGLNCEVYGADKIKELKMGAFWGVAQGSDEPPALIVMRYEPAGAPEKPVLGLVGKGVTFDTGGISIKPADGMEKMKYDMGGGATMLGVLRALAKLKPSIEVMAVV